MLTTAARPSARRPDLQELALSCANTNTTLPYIDIVNEILESYVALGLKLDESSARDTAQSTTPELDANPQYVNPRAYEILDQAVASDHGLKNHRALHLHLACQHGIRGDYGMRDYIGG